ncbi:aromatic ring-opening dioxygenase LigA [Serratia sp. Leaf50]|nr:aromatic ring-opening dioxygenase LigA [Serratia sp. Leaf50]
MITSDQRQPSLFIAHGGGPCFFMDWQPADAWDNLAAWLRTIGDALPARPKALLVVSAHWEASEPTVTSAAQPALVYDYNGFPPHTYQLQWPAPGSPELAARVRELLGADGIASRADPHRGLDHGVFIPLMLGFPQADIPTVQLSLHEDLDPARHIAIGKALAPLRDEGVLIIGSGFSYHGGLGRPGQDIAGATRRFDEWLTATVETTDPVMRSRALMEWEEAPDARICHPRSEHLVPLFVTAGAADDATGRRVFHDHLFSTMTYSAYRFG